MQIDKKDFVEFANVLANAVVNTLEKRLNIENPTVKQTKTAYQKTEQLLYNYLGFKNVVQERLKEIEEIKAHGVPKTSGSIVEYSPKTGTVGQIVLEEETVEDAVRNVQRSVQGTVQVISLIDKCMLSLKNDPYYDILEMRYFEGRTQEDIALHFKCTQKTISINKSRLVKELSIRLFPDQVIDEYMR